MWVFLGHLGAATELDVSVSFPWSFSLAPKRTADDTKPAQWPMAAYSAIRLAGEELGFRWLQTHNRAKVDCTLTVEDSFPVLMISASQCAVGKHPSPLLSL